MYTLALEMRQLSWTKDFSELFALNNKILLQDIKKIFISNTSFKLSFNQCIIKHSS